MKGNFHVFAQCFGLTRDRSFQKVLLVLPFLDVQSNIPQNSQVRSFIKNSTTAFSLKVFWHKSSLLCCLCMKLIVRDCKHTNWPLGKLSSPFLFSMMQPNVSTWNKLLETITNCCALRSTCDCIKLPETAENIEALIKPETDSAFLAALFSSITLSIGQFLPVKQHIAQKSLSSMR